MGRTLTDAIRFFGAYFRPPFIPPLPSQVPPVLIGTALVAIGVHLLCKRRLSSPALFETALPLILWILFLLYPLIANVAFEAFSCYKLNDGSRFLIKDVSINCNSPN